MQQEINPANFPRLLIIKIEKHEIHCQPNSPRIKRNS